MTDGREIPIYGYGNVCYSTSLCESIKQVGEMGLTYWLWNRIDPDFSCIDTLNNVHPGYQFSICEGRWRVFCIDPQKEIIFCRRVQDNGKQ